VNAQGLDGRKRASWALFLFVSAVVRDAAALLLGQGGDLRVGQLDLAGRIQADVEPRELERAGVSGVGAVDLAERQGITIGDRAAQVGDQGGGAAGLGGVSRRRKADVIGVADDTHRGSGDRAALGRDADRDAGRAMGSGHAFEQCIHLLSAKLSAQARETLGVQFLAEGGAEALQAAELDGEIVGHRASLTKWIAGAQSDRRLCRTLCLQYRGEGGVWQCGPSSL
jgi:hypothetical protein